MEGADESTELRQHPLNLQFLVNHVVTLVTSLDHYAVTILLPDYLVGEYEFL